MVGGPYSGSANGEVTLTTIPRASSVTCADGNIGSSTVININRASSSFTHTLKYAFGSLSGTIVTKTANISYGWAIPTTFYTQIPNAKSGQGVITCETYNGDTLIGTSTCIFNAIALEANNIPTITAVITDTNGTTTALTGDANKLIKYFSNVKVTMTATAKNSATITSQKVTCGDGKSSTSATDILYGVESGIFNLYCTDSRGFVGTNTVTKTMINYIKLAITSMTIARESSTSNTVKISIKGNYFNGSFGTVANTLILKWRYRIENGTWSGYTSITPTLSGNTFSYNGTLGTIFDYQQVYEFEVVVQDKLMTDPKTRTVTAGTPLVDIWKDNIKINGTSTLNGDLTVKSNSYFEGWVGVYGNMSVTGDMNLAGYSKAQTFNSFFTGVLSGSDTGFWVYIGDFQFNNQGQQAIIDLYSGDGQNGYQHQNTHAKVILKQGWTGGALPIGVTTNFTQNFADTTKMRVAIYHETLSKCKLYIYLNWGYSDLTCIINGSYQTFTPVFNWSTGGEPTYDKESTYFYNGGRILYNNSLGTTGTVTLTDSALEYRYLEIYYHLLAGGNTYNSYCKVETPNGKNASLNVNRNISNNQNQFLGKFVNINGINITKINEGFMTQTDGIITYGSSDNIYITKVIGYR